MTMAKQLFKMLFYENGSASLTKVLTFGWFVLFAIVSLYLAFTSQTWGDYEFFAAIAGGGGAATQIGNKFINSKYNTPIGGFGNRPPHGAE